MANIIGEGTMWVNPETGEAMEVRSEGVFMTKEEKELRRRKALQSNIDGHRDLEFKLKKRAQGSFTVMLCNDFNNLYAEDVSSPTLNKLIYLSTFMGKDNVLMQEVYWDGNVQVGKPMTKEDIQNKLGINRNHFGTFWRECKKHNLITQDEDGNFRLPSDMFRFCNNAGINKKKTAMVSVFRHAVRYMYENTDEHSKRILAYLYRLIPFINLKYNVLCENPFETDEKKVKPLKLSQICEKFGIDASHQSRFITQLKKLKYEDKLGRKSSVITYRWIYLNDEEIYWVNINPSFYMGYLSIADTVDLMDSALLNAEDKKTLDLLLE